MTARERDFPIGHPAAADYDGQPYNPPGGGYPQDFPEGHPARHGANTRDIDTPDGMRDAMLKQRRDFDELAAIGAFPVDREHEADKLMPEGTPDEKAIAFLVEHGYTAGAATALLEQVGSDRILASGASAHEAKEG